VAGYRDAIQERRRAAERPIGVIGAPEVNVNAAVANSPGRRLVSLDLLRGITIAFMILVNNNGDGERAFWALKHTQWNGFTPTDLVFPTFLFLVGVSLVFSTDSRLAKGDSRLSIALHAVRRTVILFALGLVVNGYPQFIWSSLRIYGVLQRIALCYLIGSLVYLVSKRVSVQVALLVAALAGYWILMRFVPIPGFGVPGRDFPLLDKDINLVAFIDRHLLPGRLYEGTRDPEGLLSTLPAVGTLLCGMLTARWLRSALSLGQKLQGLAIAGVAALAAGGLWNFWFPVNKKLWTSSYVLYAAGWSLLALAFCFWIVEIRQQKRGLRPWLVFGTNAIAAYVFAELFQSTLNAIQVGGSVSLQRWIYLHMLGVVPWPAWASLLYSICFVAVCFIPVAILYRKQIFIKV
jgi:predicted acyltransferase